MYLKPMDEFFQENLRYTRMEGDSMYYVQIINPTRNELCEATVSADNRTKDSYVIMQGGVLCL